jgi:glycosyltransferase involved in cell wall biosynthesis
MRDNQDRVDPAPLPVTVVIPTLDEERHLGACLNQIIGFHEVLVIDSLSRDATREIAAKAGAKVMCFEWKGGFPKKRNWVLLNYKFSTPWVLFLDADEMLTQPFRVELKEALNSKALAGYWLNYTTHFRGKILRYGIRQKKLALFRVGSGLFERIEDPGWSSLDMEVHEHAILDGKVGEILSPIDHIEVLSLQKFIQRHNEYSSWEASRYLSLQKGSEAILTARQRLKYRYIEKWWYPFAYFLVTYFLRFGFLDGRAGFVYAFSKCAYFLELQEKIFEARRLDRR